MYRYSPSPPSAKDVHNFLLTRFYQVSSAPGRPTIGVIHSANNREGSFDCNKTSDKTSIVLAQDARVMSDAVSLEYGWEQWRDVAFDWGVEIAQYFIGTGNIRRLVNIERPAEIIVEDIFDGEPILVATVPIIESYHISSPIFPRRLLQISLKQQITLRMELLPLQDDNDDLLYEEGAYPDQWLAYDIKFEGGWRPKKGIIGHFYRALVVPIITFFMLIMHAIWGNIEPTTAPPLRFEDIFIIAFGPLVGSKLFRVLEPLEGSIYRKMRRMAYARTERKRLDEQLQIARRNAQQLHYSYVLNREEMDETGVIDVGQEPEDKNPTLGTGLGSNKPNYDKNCRGKMVSFESRNQPGNKSAIVAGIPHQELPTQDTDSSSVYRSSFSRLSRNMQDEHSPTSSLHSSALFKFDGESSPHSSRTSPELFPNQEIEEWKRQTVNDDTEGLGLIGTDQESRVEGQNLKPLKLVERMSSPPTRSPPCNAARFPITKIPQPQSSCGTTSSSHKTSTSSQKEDNLRSLLPWGGKIVRAKSSSSSATVQYLENITKAEFTIGSTTPKAPSHAIVSTSLAKAPSSTSTTSTGSDATIVPTQSQRVVKKKNRKKGKGKASQES